MMPLFRTLKSHYLIILLLVTLTTAIGWAVVHEMRSSSIQAHYFSTIASQLTYTLGKGASPSIRFPKPSPYDERLGYSNIPVYTHLLTTHGFIITDQARLSPSLLQLPLSPIYSEKDQAGLILMGRHQRLLYSLMSPERVYGNFEMIPKLLTDTLLFIEDRELLDPRYPSRNPAINWSRLNRALFDQMLHVIHRKHDTPGASTLATQIEKYRHSPEGRTASIHEKLLQMESATIHSYLNGINNMNSRRQIVVTYLNTVPLTAKMGYGEINGLGDGMWVWYNHDFLEFNDILRKDGNELNNESLQRQASAYKQALSLMIAQRRPSYYLRSESAVLLHTTNHYLQLLEAANIISPALLKAALPLPLPLHHGPVVSPASSFIANKGANLLRNDLSSLLHLTNLYTLDRIDLKVQSTLDIDTQQAITDRLRQVQSPAGAQAAELYGHNMLGKDDDPRRLSFSFTLYERGPNANILRVQTDNLDQPFDINSGARLNLGSTAKLRTLISYLEIITHLHQSYAKMSSTKLSQVQVSPHNALLLWALTYFSANPNCSLGDTLNAAMLRTYSGDPSEMFFTGGGMQKFENFEPTKDNGIMTVQAGFQNSVNLIFVRLMRDIVYYYEEKNSGITEEFLIRDPSTISTSPTPLTEDSLKTIWQAQLSRFADQEGREFLYRFYKKYKGKTSDEMIQILVNQIPHPHPRNLTLLYLSIVPEANFQQLTTFMQKQLPTTVFNDESLRTLYTQFSREKYSLTDQGYLTKIHPLELWLVSYLLHHPSATLAQLVTNSTDQRQEVYKWLFKTHHTETQDSRIHQMLEREAFQNITADWRHLGYPFDALTPSYATALGASGDRPDSLAKLMGIIVNHGLLMPVIELQSLQFAQGTPYETDFAIKPVAGVQVLPKDVTDVVRSALINVVQGGTGVRLKNGLIQKNGQAIEVGGKTGTGDQRFVTYAPNNKLISSRAVNRSATFVFLIGDRFFGTVTAYVHEPYAADYTFTSALTVQLLKSMTPILNPIVQ